MRNLRPRFELGTLPPEMAAALDEALGDVWRVRHYHVGFSNILDRVKTFQQSKGRLPQRRDVDADGVKIGLWVQTQRSKHHAGRLSAERVAALEGVPGWTWKYFVNSEVYVWLDALRAFEEANGRIAKRRDTWDGMKVGMWVANQRRGYHKGLLAAELLASLEAVPGWVWKKSKKRSHKIPFESWLASLNRFAQAHRCLPSATEVGDEPDLMHLGCWVNRCRVRKKQGKLTPDQIAALEQVPGWCWRSKTPFRL